MSPDWPGIRPEPTSEPQTSKTHILKNCFLLGIHSSLHHGNSSSYDQVVRVTESWGSPRRTAAIMGKKKGKKLSKAGEKLGFIASKSSGSNAWETSKPSTRAVSVEERNALGSPSFVLG